MWIAVLTWMQGVQYEDKMGEGWSGGSAHTRERER
jgi:hypothetical protein